jgi:hypothetical protein
MKEKVWLVAISSPPFFIFFLFIFFFFFPPSFCPNKIKFASLKNKTSIKKKYKKIPLSLQGALGLGRGGWRGQVAPFFKPSGTLAGEVSLV